MKSNIATITVELNGQEVTREYVVSEFVDWDKVVNSMLETLEGSKDVKEF